MAMNPIWRVRIWATAATVVALVLGYQIALGNLLGAAVVGLGTLAIVGYRYQPRNLQFLVLAGLFAGYLIGNRGFAQLMPAPGIPLLPAEAGLAALCILQALERAGSDHPRRLDLLDYLIGAWILFGVGRMFFDGRIYGIVAIRDFAMVYYAAFFYLAANLVHRHANQLEKLLQVTRIAALVMGVIYVFTRTWPGVLENALLFRGVPLIFYKDDLVGVFAALGAVLHFLRFEQAGRWRSVCFSLALVGVVLFSNNRSALLALVVGAGGLVLAGRWRFGGLLGLGGLVGAILLIAAAAWRGDTWRDTPLIGVYERVVSLADPLGEGQYGGERTANKGDNNLFRWVWWQEVISETAAKSPVAGLGFGYDLSSRFVREYYGVGSLPFTARSPHSIVVTVFGRMGIMGLSLYASIIAILAWNVWRKARQQALAELTPFLGAAMIFTSASFGVVLEGPMGAVLFWSLLGAGAGLVAARREGAADETQLASDQEVTDSPPESRGVVAN
jgi:hypothetical protein